MTDQHTQDPVHNALEAFGSNLCPQDTLGYVAFMLHVKQITKSFYAYRNEDNPSLDVRLEALSVPFLVGLTLSATAINALGKSHPTRAKMRAQILHILDLLFENETFETELDEILRGKNA